MGNPAKKWIEMLLRICWEHIGNLGTCKNPSDNLMICMKLMCCREWVAKHVENHKGTGLEPLGNLMGTHLQQTRKPKECPPQPPKTQKKKKAHIERSDWLHQISVSKSVCHHLQLGPIKPPLLFSGHSVIHIITAWAPLASFFFFKGATLTGISATLFEKNIGAMPQIEAPLSSPSCKKKQMYTLQFAFLVKLQGS
jgi:hypothetical protein